jgi:hypothetical protein
LQPSARSGRLLLFKTEAVPFAPRLIDHERDSILQRTETTAQRISVQNARITVSTQ